MTKKSWGFILAVILAAVAFTYLQVLILQWAISLFYPISKMQAFAIIVVVDMISLPFRRVAKK